MKIFIKQMLDVLTKLINMNKPEVVFMEPILGDLVGFSYPLSYEHEEYNFLSEMKIPKIEKEN